jgi:hypothetical protein
MVCDRIIPYSYPPGLVLSGRWVHRVQVHIVPLSMLICAGCTIPGFAGDAFGIWKVNPIRSVDPRPMTLIVRFEPHSKGEVFTLDTTDRLGRASTSSTILYFDSKPRDFQDLGCSGTQLALRSNGSLRVERFAGLLTVHRESSQSPLASHGKATAFSRY